MTEIYVNYEGIQYQSALTSNHLVKHRSFAIQLIQQQQTPIEYINPFETSLQSKYDLLLSKSVKNPSRGKFSTFSALQILDFDILPSTTTNNTTQKHRYTNAINPSNDNIHQLATCHRSVPTAGPQSQSVAKSHAAAEAVEAVGEPATTTTVLMRWMRQSPPSRAR